MLASRERRDRRNVALGTSFVGKVPRTLRRLTDAVREGLLVYRDRFIEVLSRLPE